MSTYVKNCYGKPSRLFVTGGEELKSSEGTTQGDPMAMPAYGVGILPFLTYIKHTDDEGKMKQVAYADDIGGGSRLKLLKEWWDRTVENGPALGYYPKASKSWLVVKEEKLEEAKDIFKETGINITIDGNFPYRYCIIPSRIFYAKQCS